MSHRRLALVDHESGLPLQFPGARSRKPARPSRLAERLAAVGAGLQELDRVMDRLGIAAGVACKADENGARTVGCEWERSTNDVHDLYGDAGGEVQGDVDGDACGETGGSGGDGDGGEHTSWVLCEHGDADDYHVAQDGNLEDEEWVELEEAEDAWHG